MTAKQLSVFIENRRGRLGEVLKVLKDNNVNILSMSLADTTEYGLLRLIVNAPDHGRDVLLSAGFSSMITDILIVKVPHVAGSLQERLTIISENNIDIEYMYGLSVEANDATIVVKTNELERACEVLKKAEMQVGSVDVPGYNFIRHYLRQDGTYSGSGFGSTATPIVSHAGEVDEEMRLIQFVRKDAENVVLMNWQAHGVLISHRQNGTEEYQQISSDYIGGIRDYVEKKTGCKLAYFQGAAGNIDPDSYITHENPTRNPELYGKNVGDFAVQCLKDNMKKIEAGPVLTHAFTFDGRVNHADEHLLDAAYALKASGSTNLADAQKLGLISRHHATTIIRCTGLGETLPVPCSVLSVGNIGFACAPFELFSATGVAIREESPFDTTFILGYCNNSQGYLPTEFGFDINSYEEACTNFARGVAEELVAAYAAKWAELKP